MKTFAILLVLLSFMGCRKTHREEAMARGGVDVMTITCAHLHDLGCHDGPGGPCEQVYRRLGQDLGAERETKVHACLLDAGTLDAAYACGVMGCL